MLVQIDANPHDWLEGRGPKLTLLCALDDATGQILVALFRLTEDFDNCLAIRSLTQIGRLLNELDIQHIPPRPLPAGQGSYRTVF
jgi:hypothetical protein